MAKGHVGVGGRPLSCHQFTLIPCPLQADGLHLSAAADGSSAHVDASKQTPGRASHLLHALIDSCLDAQQNLCDSGGGLDFNVILYHSVGPFFDLL